MKKRVVVTGMGVVAPNGIGIPAFLNAIQNGISGIKFIPHYRELNFSCQVAGMPAFDWESLKNYISEVTFHGLKGTNIGYGVAAALDAWADSGMPYDTDEPRWETGCVFELVSIAHDHGFFWGGHFNAPRVDGMHFEVAKIV